MFRSSYRRWSVRKGVLRNFAKFTGKHLCQSLFFNKVAGLIDLLPLECVYMRVFFKSVYDQSLLTVFIKYPEIKLIAAVISLWFFDRNQISFWVIKCDVNTTLKWNHTKKTSAHANTEEIYYSIWCCGMGTAIKSVFWQRNKILLISVSNWT